MIPSFQIHVAKYLQNGIQAEKKNRLPRYWVTVGKKVVFDYPRSIEDKGWYPWSPEMSNISDIIENYLNCPKENLLYYRDEFDIFGLVLLLKVCDIRMGKRRLNDVKKQVNLEFFNLESKKRVINILDLIDIIERRQLGLL